MSTDIFRRRSCSENVNRIAPPEISSWVAKFSGEVVGVDILYSFSGAPHMYRNANSLIARSSAVYPDSARAPAHRACSRKQERQHSWAIGPGMSESQKNRDGLRPSWSLWPHMGQPVACVWNSMGRGAPWSISPEWSPRAQFQKLKCDDQIHHDR